MKAVLINTIGEPKVLDIQNIPKPKITNAYEVLVKIKAASVNPIDIKLRAGDYALNNFPAILGCDAAGIVDEVGSKVTKVKKGDHVYYFHGGLDGIQGNYAEYKLLNQRFIAKKPESINFIEAAAIPLVAITAWESLFYHAKLTKNKSIYINAGAGGVGHVAIQLAKYTEAVVFTSVSSDKKAEFVKELGADHVINYKKQNISKEILKLTNNQGVDIVLDNIGGDVIEKIIPAVCHYGKVITLLQPNNKINWALARFRNINLCFEVMLSPLLFNIKHKQLKQTKILENCSKLIDKGDLRIHIDASMPLEYVAKAHEKIQKGNTMGKIVLEIK
tara:strand:+ start:2277 stop:3272 length:996 start_codon:yes stop_codon:yes gene_type:complete